MSAALSSLLRDILGESFSKLFSADESELLGAMLVSALGGANIVIYRTSCPFPSSYAVCNSVGTSNMQKIFARDTVDAITESVREREEPSYTKPLQHPNPIIEPVPLCLPLPLPLPLSPHVKARRKVPLWRRIFRNLCCTTTAEITSDTRESSEGACTPPTPTPALLPNNLNDMHDPEPLNSYDGKYLLMCLREGIGIVTREEGSSEVSRDGAVYRKLIFSSEIKIGNILEGHSISNGRRICFLAPEVISLRPAKCSIRSNGLSIDEKELLKCDNTPSHQDLVGAEGRFEIQVAAYQDIRVLVCIPRPQDIVATHLLDSGISSDTARVEAKAGTDRVIGLGTGVGTEAGTGARVGRVLCPPGFPVLSPLSQIAWKQFHILCSMCLADAVEDIQSPRLVK